MPIYGGCIESVQTRVASEPTVSPYVAPGTVFPFDLDITIGAQIPVDNCDTSSPKASLAIAVMPSDNYSFQTNPDFPASVVTLRGICPGALTGRPGFTALGQPWYLGPTGLSPTQPTDWSVCTVVGYALNADDLYVDPRPLCIDVKQFTGVVQTQQQQIFTGNFTGVAGSLAGHPCIVQGWGSGGGGGGAAGGYFSAYLPAGLDVGATLTIGAAGTGGVGGAAGATGGDLVLTTGALTMTAKGGLGGGTLATGVAAAVVLGGLGVAGTGGDLLSPGEPGRSGLRFNANVGVGGDGGSASPVGVGGQGPNVQSNGSVATGYASGGSGSASLAAGAATNGGAGTKGLLIVNFIA